MHIDHHQPLSATSTIPLNNSLDALDLKIHQKYCFEDGSAIIVIDAGQPAYKIHRSIFQKHSPFFKDFFTSRNEFGKGVWEGCAAYQLPEHYATVREIEVLVSYLYHDLDLDTHTPLQELCALIHVSAPLKCNLPDIYRRSLDFLDARFPVEPLSTHFSNWKDVEVVLPLATELGLTKLRTALFYSLISSDVNTDDNPSLTGSSLSEADTAKISELVDYLSQSFSPTLFQPAAALHMACTNAIADQWMDKVVTPALEDGGLYKVIDTLRLIRDIKWEEVGVCKECCVAKRKEWDEEILEVWKELEQRLSLI